MSARFPACVSDGCRCGRDPCPTPIECGLAPPDVPRPTQPGELGEDENGAMERLERSDLIAMGAGLVQAVMAILVLLIVLWSVGELRAWFDARGVQAQEVRR